MPIPQSALFKKCVSVASPPEPFGLLEIVKSKLSDFVNGTAGWNSGFQLAATGAAATLAGESVNNNETAIKVDDVLHMSKANGFFIIGDPLDTVNREIIEYLNVDIEGQEEFLSCIRGSYGSTAQSHSNNSVIEQLHWRSDGGIVGNDLTVQPHRWTHRKSGGTEPPAAFDTAGICGCVDTNGNLWAFHPTSATSPVWKFDISAGTWSNPAITGTYTPVTDALCVYDSSRDKVFILGGVDTAASNVSTLQIFDIATLAFSTGTATIKAGPLIGAYHTGNDRIVYYTSDNGFATPVQGRAYEYDIGGDSHTSKAIDAGQGNYLIENDNAEADAVYNSIDNKIYFVGNISAGGKKLRTYDLASDTWVEVGNMSVVTGPSYRVTIFPDSNRLFLTVRGYTPPDSNAKATYTHKVGEPASAWTRQDDVFQARAGEVLGYDSETKSAVRFGGAAIGSPGGYSDLVGPGFWRPFFQNTVYRTKVFDMLILNPSGVIAGDVIFLIDDIVPADSTVTYEAEHATSASGPWTSIGAVVDGQTENIQKRYWRLTATFTVNGFDAPAISKMEVAYQKIATYATNPQAVPANVAPVIDGLILDMPTAAGKVDIEKGRGSVAGVNVDLDDSLGLARKLQQDGRLLDADAKFTVGFNLPTFRKSDMLPIYTGTISALDVNLGTVTLALKDARDYLRTKVPIGADGTSPTPIDYDVGGISNPALVLRDILEQAGVPGRSMSDGSFANAALHANALHNCRRTIEEPREIRKYAEELNQLIDGVLIADANGKLTYKVYDATSAPVATIHPNEQDGKWEMSQEFADKINTATVYGDSSTEDGKEVLDYAFAAREQDGALVISDQIVRDEILLGPWIGPDNGTYEGLDWAREIAVRRLARKKIGVQRLKGTLVGLKHSNLEEGDVIRLVSDSYFESPRAEYENSHFWPYSVEGQSFIRDNKWVVTSRKVDFVKGKVSLELARARVPLSVTTDSSTVVLGAENVTINASNQVALIAGKTTGYVTVLIDVDQCPDLIGNYTTVATVPSGATLTTTITPSHDGRFDPRFERVTPIINAPLSSTTLLDGDAKRRFYAFRYDLDEGTAGAGNGPVITSLTVSFPGG